MDWSSGYVVEIDYTHGYFRELDPNLLRLACALVGVAPPPAKDFTYLELGFGQGLSLNIHAAAHQGAFWGSDFMPNQVAQARWLAQAAGSQLIALEDSFL